MEQQPDKLEVPQETAPKPPRGKRVRLILCRILAAFLAVTALLACVFAFWGAQYVGMDHFKDFDPDKLINLRQTTVIYDGAGQEAASLYSKENRIKVPLSSIPLHVQQAFIATEDSRFYQHNGVDYKRMGGALLKNIRTGSLSEGASTISQQLIKLTHLTTEKTIPRKVQEVMLALEMERRYSKDEILEMYLNLVYFGHGAYGVQAASQVYFGKDAQQLTLEEGALLAGIVKNPSQYAPHLHLDKATDRRNMVLKLMADNGYIDEATRLAAREQPIELVEGDRPLDYDHGFYVDAVIEEALDILGVTAEEFYSGGYRIDTQMDPALQTQCEALFAQGSSFPGQGVQGAVVILDATTGRARALVGGREYAVKRGLNRATAMRRQPGSTIKPLAVYAPALEQFGYTAASFVTAKPINIEGYSPGNSSGKYYGDVTLREALNRSLNAPAIQVLRDIGVAAGFDYLTRVGLSPDAGDANLALALGGMTHGVTPLDLAAAYAPFATGGLYLPGGTISRITDADGNVLYQAPTQGERVLSEDTAYILTDMLKTVISEGTGKALKIDGIPLAGKTGTVEEVTGGSRDIWMAAYNPEVVAICWMGADDARAGRAIAESAGGGGSYPARLLKQVFESLYPNGGPDFTAPASVQAVALDAYALTEEHAARLATELTPEQERVTEYFRPGTAPTQTSRYYAPPQAPDDVGITSVNGVIHIHFTAADSFVRYSVYRYGKDGGKTLIEQIQQPAGTSVTVRDIPPTDAQCYQIEPSHTALLSQGQALLGTPTGMLPIP